MRTIWLILFGAFCAFFAFACYEWYEGALTSLNSFLILGLIIVMLRERVR